jgi:orotate phosphoribosyltransferase
VECLEKASEIYVDMGRFNMAAKINSTIAEIFEMEAPDKARCIKHHQIVCVLDEVFKFKI